MRTIDRDTGAARVTNNGARNRAESYRQRMTDAGYVQVTGWVNSDQQADAIEYLKALRLNPQLTTGPLRDSDTRRLVGIQAALNAEFEE